MKAIALTPGTTQLRLADWPEPKIETPTQIKVKTILVGVCGTDRDEVTGGRADAPKGAKELIIGHEMVGMVLEVGSQVKSLAPKDLVVPMVRRGCGLCHDCKQGFFDLCTTGLYSERGIKGLHGFQSQFVVDEASYFIKVPSELSHLAVLTEPTTVVEKAIDTAFRLQRARLPAWDARPLALVAGLGPVGLLASIILRLRGIHVVGFDIVDPHSHRPTLLKAIGGEYVQSLSAFKEQHGSCDLIIEAVGIAKVEEALLEHLGANGIYALTGVPRDETFPIDGGAFFRQLVMKNQILFGSVNANHSHFEQAVKDLNQAHAKWPGVIEKMITRKVPYLQYDQAFNEKGKDDIKVVIDWNS